MSAFAVDTEALAALAARMAATRERVERALGSVEDCSAGAAGLLGDAVAEFAGHWKYGLTRIAGNVGACEQALAQAARSYDEVDRAVAGACGG